MLLFSQSLATILFVALGAVVLIGLIIGCTIPIVKHHRKKHFKYYFYKDIYKIALYDDVYLINNFKFKFDDNVEVTVDHILFHNKYIYVINDYWFDGDIVGKFNDSSLVLTDKKGNKDYIDNLYSLSGKLLTRMSIATGLPKDFLIGVNIVNEKCRLDIQSDNKQIFTVQISDIKKLVKTIESRNVFNINADQLQKAVLVIDKINLNKKEGTKKDPKV